jgi:exosome complex component RRP4
MFKIKDRELVLPGQLLGENVLAGEYCFKEDKNVFSSVRGLARINRNFVKVIPFDGEYVPKKGDVLVCVVEEITAGGWFVDINSGYRCYMRGEEATRNPMQEDLSRYYGIGEIFTAIVGYVNEIYKCDLIKPWKIRGGMIIDVSPKKVPRIVGKNKSMINMMRDKLGCKIVVGQNGRVWFDCEDVDNLNFAVRIIRKIEAESHISGLTDKIGNLIDEELNKKDKT